MKKSSVFCSGLIGMLIFLFPATAAADDQKKVIGWADVGSDNGRTGTFVQTTSGGAGGEEISVSSGMELSKAIENLKSIQMGEPATAKSALTITFSGALTYGTAMLNLKGVSNLSIIGAGNNAKISGFGLNIFTSQNIIIQNIFFENCPDDAINITDGAHHVWVDHCSFSDLPFDAPASLETATSDARHDGCIDIRKESSYITVSYCRFENHDKTMLLGHDGKYTQDKGRLKVTLHHNWFGYVYQRTTRNRFGMMHLFNNYYKGTGSMLMKNSASGIWEHGYAIASVCEANVVVENNYFQDVIWPALVSRTANDPLWLAAYGKTENGQVHWGPTSSEPPGFLTYRGTNIQNPAAGTPLVQKEFTWNILPLDTTNPDPNNWNPWESYGYSSTQISGILDKAEDIPAKVTANAGAGKP